MSRQAEISAESRRRLLDATYELCAESGARGASVQAIAERAGISRGSIAWHFGSKDGLVLAAVAEAFDWAVGELTAALAEPGPSGLDRVVAAQVRLVTHPRGRIFGTLLPEALAASDALTQAYAQGYARIRQCYADHLRAHGAADGPGADALAAALFGLALGLNVQWRLDPEHVDRDAAVRALGPRGAGPPAD